MKARSFSDIFQEAIQNRDIETLKQIAQSAAQKGLISMSPEQRLEGIIGMQVTFFGGSPDKIKRDISILTNSRDVKVQTNFLINNLIEQLPDEPKDPLFFWYTGQILRSVRTHLASHPDSDQVYTFIRPTHTPTNNFIN